MIKQCQICGFMHDYLMESNCYGCNGKDFKGMSKKSFKDYEKFEAIGRLHELLKNNDKVYTIVNHVSASGMSRVISCYIAQDNEINNITFYVARATENKRDKKHEGVKIGGCGMDMGFSLIYDLSYVLNLKLNQKWL